MKDEFESQKNVTMKGEFVFKKS